MLGTGATRPTFSPTWVASCGKWSSQRRHSACTSRRWNSSAVTGDRHGRARVHYNLGSVLRECGSQRRRSARSSAPWIVPRRRGPAQRRRRPGRSRRIATSNSAVPRKQSRHPSRPWFVPRRRGPAQRRRRPGRSRRIATSNSAVPRKQSRHPSRPWFVPRRRGPAQPGPGALEPIEVIPRAEPAGRDELGARPGDRPARKCGRIQGRRRGADGAIGHQFTTATGPRAGSARCGRRQRNLLPAPLIDRAQRGTLTETLRRGTRVTREDRRKLATDLKNRYDAGESIRSLAASTGRSYGFIHRILTESGCNPARPWRSQSKR